MGALYRARGARSAVTRYPEAAEAAQTAEAVLPAVDARARYRLACIYARRTQQSIWHHVEAKGHAAVLLHVGA